MATGTLDLTRVEEERRRLEETDPEVVAHRIVEEVLAAEAALETPQADGPLDEVHETREDDGRLTLAGPFQRRDFVLLTTDEPLVLVPGPTYEPATSAFVPSPDPLRVLVDDALASVQTAPQTISDALRGAADSPAMPATRWMLFGLLWMAAFAGLVPFAFATIGNSIDMQIEVFGEETEEATIEQQPADVTSTDNPSVDD